MLRNPEFIRRCREDTDFRRRVRARELTNREFYGYAFYLGEEDFTTAGDLLLYVTDSERPFETVELSNQVLDDRRYLIRRDYFTKIEEGIFQTWENLLFKEEGLFSDVFKEVDSLAKRVWNYGYFKTKFALDDYRLNTTLERKFGTERVEFSRSPAIATHTQGGNLGFSWHFGHTSQEIYDASGFITELCPSLLPPGIEVQDYEELPVLLLWREFDTIYQDLDDIGVIKEVPDLIVPETYGGHYSCSFGVAIFCKARDLLRFRFIGVPDIDTFRQEFIDYYCERRGIPPYFIEGTWDSGDGILTETSINPHFANEVDTIFTRPTAPTARPEQAPQQRYEAGSDSTDIFKSDSSDDEVGLL